MRLAGQIKGGYYPVPPPAIELLLAHLESPDGPFSLMDPCCGEGRALKQLAEGLGCAPASTYGIELSDTRAEQAAVNLAGCQLLAPASFEGTTISAGSLSAIWLNPPYDDEMGGGARVEYNFLLRATRLLRTKGVLMLAMPERVMRQDRDLQRHIMANYREIGLLRYPDEHRHYDECIILAVKRASAVSLEHGERFLPETPVYKIPAGAGPARFEKSCLTASEIRRLLAASPLRRTILGEEEEDDTPRPPIPLGVGHTALLVASGQLDGIVRPPDEPPHVVRGTVRKSTYLARVEVKENEKSTSTTSIYNERIDPIVRIVAQDGEIITLGGQPPEDADQPQEEHNA
jgi:hypothetical protein